MRYKCKITVIEKGCNKALGKYMKKNPDWIAECDIVELGQEFYVDNMFFPPKGLCESAWADIRQFIMAVATGGGEFDFMVDTKSTIATCCDPFRPVLFKIERLEE